MGRYNYVLCCMNIVFAASDLQNHFESHDSVEWRRVYADEIFYCAPLHCLFRVHLVTSELGRTHLAARARRQSPPGQPTSEKRRYSASSVPCLRRSIQIQNLLNRHDTSQNNPMTASPRSSCSRKSCQAANTNQIAARPPCCSRCTDIVPPRQYWRAPVQPIAPALGITRAGRNAIGKILVFMGSRSVICSDRDASAVVFFHHFFDLDPAFAAARHAQAVLEGSCHCRIHDEGHSCTGGQIVKTFTYVQNNDRVVFCCSNCLTDVFIQRPSRSDVYY